MRKKSYCEDLHVYLFECLSRRLRFRCLCLFIAFFLLRLTLANENHPPSRSAAAFISLSIARRRSNIDPTVIPPSPATKRAPSLPPFIDPAVVTALSKLARARASRVARSAALVVSAPAFELHLVLITALHDADPLDALVVDGTALAAVHRDVAFVTARATR